MEIDKEVSEHFENFIFDWSKRYYFLVGGYGSGKSYHTALKIILKLLSEQRTALVIREVYETIRESCFSLFVEIINNLELNAYANFSVSPLSIKFFNGSKIIFRGLDKPAKLKSINNISIAWIEECSEISYEGFKEIIKRLRHPTLQIHFILTTNPVGYSNWCYRHFFKNGENVTLDEQLLYKNRIVTTKTTYYHHSTADDNTYLQKEYIDELEDTKRYDLDLYRIARLGHFGVVGTKVLPQFEVKPHYEVIEKVSLIDEKYKRVGFDFGFEVSYNAVVRVAIDPVQLVLYIYWEYYKNHLTDDKTAIELQEFKETEELIRADNAQPSTIMYFRQQGFRIMPATKFPGSRLSNTRKIKRFRSIICSRDCINAVRELEGLTYKTDKDGNIIEDEFNIDSHVYSAIWYALDGYEVSDLKKHDSKPQRRKGGENRR